MIHSIFVGYFLNPQFQYGVEHGADVYKETFEETSKVIVKLKRNIDDQIRTLNQVSNECLHFNLINLEIII